MNSPIVIYIDKWGRVQTVKAFDGTTVKAIVVSPAKIERVPENPNLSVEDFDGERVHLSIAHDHGKPRALPQLEKRLRELKAHDR